MSYKILVRKRLNYIIFASIIIGGMKFLLRWGSSAICSNGVNIAALKTEVEKSGYSKRAIGILDHEKHEIHESGEWGMLPVTSVASYQFR